MKKKIIPLVLVLAIGGGAYYFFRSGANSDEITAYGNVDIRSVDLGFRVGGRLLEMLVQEGDSVKVGQLLARLDQRPFELELAGAEANVSALEARLSMIKAGYREEEVAQAKAARDARKATLDNAQLYLDRQTRLYRERVVAQSAYDDAKAKRDEASAALRAAEESLQQLKSGFRPEELAEAEARLLQARAASEQAALRLSDASLFASADAVALTRAVEPGAMLNAGNTVYTLSLTRPVWVRAFVSETDLGLISPGQEVLVYSDSWPDKPYRGTIGYISPQAEFTPKSVETPDLRTTLVFRLRINVTSPDEGLRQGMPVTVKIAPLRRAS